MSTKAILLFGVLLIWVFTGCQESSTLHAQTSGSGTSQPDKADGVTDSAPKPMNDSEVKPAELSTPPSAEKTDSAEQAPSGVVYIDEDFDGYEIGDTPEVPELQRADKVTVFDAGDKPLPGKVARFDDSDTEKGGALEYAVGSDGSSNLYIEFDALNNDPAKGDEKSVVIFGVGPWETGKSLVLNSKSKRAFGLEFYQQKNIKLRVGSDVVTQVQI